MEEVDEESWRFKANKHKESFLEKPLTKRAHSSPMSMTLVAGEMLGESMNLDIETQKKNNHLTC